MSVVYNKGKWSLKEDLSLKYYVNQQLKLMSRQMTKSSHSGSGSRSKPHLKWRAISTMVKTRSNKQCRERWQNHLSPHVCKTPWRPEEDAAVLNLGTPYKNKWAFIASHLPGRTQNQVKIRWKSLTKSTRRVKKPKTTAECQASFNIPICKAEDNKTPKFSDSKSEHNWTILSQEPALEKGTNYNFDNYYFNHLDTPLEQSVLDVLFYE